MVRHASWSLHEGRHHAKAGQWVYAVKDGTLSKKYLDALVRCPEVDGG
jgi:hypothetical protein